MSVEGALGLERQTGSTTSATSVPEASLQEDALRTLGINISQEQFQNFLEQGQFQELLRNQALDLFSPEAIAEAETRAQESGLLSPQEEKLISDFERESLALGESDINRYTQEGLDLLKQEAAPSRGLRFSDTPILDRGNRLVTESIRQKSLLGRDIAARGATARLQQPLERQRLQEMLRENARRFRLGLSGQAGSFGLNLLQAVDPFQQQRLFLSERLAQPSSYGQSEQSGLSLGVRGAGYR